ncbi:hypothetical protein F4774DRAFT_365684 [Daldinia eschscholtzii]|nr:hypothetical protein F4774DRAFT_365684 [Daldinia eschscholtzii]
MYACMYFLLISLFVAKPVSRECRNLRFHQSPGRTNVLWASSDHFFLPFAPWIRPPFVRLSESVRGISQGFFLPINPPFASHFFFLFSLFRKLVTGGDHFNNWQDRTDIPDHYQNFAYLGHLSERPITHSPI